MKRRNKPSAAGQRRLNVEQLEPRLLLTARLPGTEGFQPHGRVTELTWLGENRQALEGQWIVKFDSLSVPGNDPVRWANEQLQRPGRLNDGKPLYQPGGNLLSYFEVRRSLSSEGVFLLSSPMDLTVEQTKGALENLAGVQYAEPNFVLTVDQTFPDDPSWPSLWGMHNTGQSGGTVDADVDAPEAWDLHTGSADVVVAVIDTGIDYDHPDLADNMWTNLGECPGGVCTANGIDDDGNGHVDDFHGIDTAFNDSDPFDGQGHGTHVAGTIGAVGNNGIGVAGINWDVQLMALKFLNDSGSGATSDAVEALDYMVRMRRDYDVNVVASNNSWSGGGYSQALVDAIQAGVDEGILFVAAAGNDGQNNDAVPSYPSSYGLEGIISVAATDRFDQLAYFSNYGAQHVDLSAPGVSILSTTPGGNYSTLNGTSMATPHVTGAVALLASAAPGAGVMELKDAILNSVEPLPALQGKTLTEGRLNVFAALQQLGMRVVGNTPAADEVVFTQPTEFVIEFSEPFDPTTIDAAALSVNGLAADQVQIDDSRTLTYSFDVSPVTYRGCRPCPSPPVRCCELRTAIPARAFRASSVTTQRSWKSKQVSSRGCDGHFATDQYPIALQRSG